jgi:hypothetical protein
MLKHIAAALTLATASQLGVAQELTQFEVTITNITRGQTFTPSMVVTHPGQFLIFKLGQPASEALEILAEGGDTGPLSEEAAAVATDVQTIPGLLGPGETTSVTVNGLTEGGYISIASMLIPTNDTFYAVNRNPLPAKGAMYLVPAYDAGTEANDQNCASIPGPRCGGEGHSPEASDGDEGFVHISNGFHGIGVEDSEGNEILGPLVYDWRNPVARITVRPVN